MHWNVFSDFLYEKFTSWNLRLEELAGLDFIEKGSDSLKSSKLSARDPKKN